MKPYGTAPQSLGPQKRVYRQACMLLENWCCCKWCCSVGSVLAVADLPHASRAGTCQCQPSPSSSSSPCTPSWYQQQTPAGETAVAHLNDAALRLAGKLSPCYIVTVPKAKFCGPGSWHIYYSTADDGHYFVGQWFAGATALSKVCPCGYGVGLSASAQTSQKPYWCVELCVILHVQVWQPPTELLSSRQACPTGGRLRGWQERSCQGTVVQNIVCITTS
jgi:hypothetical protein